MWFLKWKDTSCEHLVQVESSVASKVKFYASSFWLLNANSKTHMYIPEYTRSYTGLYRSAKLRLPQEDKPLKKTTTTIICRIISIQVVWTFPSHPPFLKLTTKWTNITRARITTQACRFHSQANSVYSLFFSLENEHWLGNVCVTLYVYKPRLASWERIGRCSRRAACLDCSWAFDKCFG